MGLVTAVHLYVSDLDEAIDFYSRVLGYGPQAAYDDGEHAQSAFFVLDDGTHLVLTWDPDRAWQAGGGICLELVADDLGREARELGRRGIEGRLLRTRSGNDVYELMDPDGRIVRLGPVWTLHAIEGAV